MSNSSKKLLFFGPKAPLPSSSVLDDWILIGTSSVPLITYSDVKEVVDAYLRT